MHTTIELFKGIRDGNKRLLGKAITLIESKKPEHRILADELLDMLMPFTGNSIRIGVTGVPGAGKSTFIEYFGLLAIEKGKKVAVLAIDPSSSVNKGSILGDKTRMEDLAKHPSSFIRPSPSSGFLGGVTNTTFETMLLCEAAGYDYILIETVGVGQSEVMVADISDVFLFLKIIGGGDELQGIKRGIMEMVDAIFINKVDETNLQKAKNTKQELLRAMQFLPLKEKNWRPPVLLGSALNKIGLEEVYTEVDKFVQLKIKQGSFQKNRSKQALKRFEYWVQQYIIQKTKFVKKNFTSYENHLTKVKELHANPSSQAQIFVNEIFRLL